MKSFLGILFLVATTLAQSEYKLHHRIIGGSGPSPFSLRGTISLPADGEATYEPANFDLATIISSTKNDEHALYQVALERPTDVKEEDWVFSSAKAVSGTVYTWSVIPLTYVYIVPSFCWDIGHYLINNRLDRYPIRR